MSVKNLSIILPTFNEAGNIIKLINSILSVCRKNKISTEIIIVDDNSPDFTGIKTQKKYKYSHSVKVFIRKNEKGLAGAVLYGIKHAHGKQVLVMDTDFNHDPKEIPEMYSLSKKFDLVIGSRYVQGGGMENRIRYYLSWIFNIYLKLLLKHQINDNLSGFFIIRRRLLNKLLLNNVFLGFGEYFMRLVYLCCNNNFKIKEIPVFYKNRIHGVSKSKFISMFITYTLTAFKLRFDK